MTMPYIPTTWGRNAMNIDMVEIMTSLHPMYFRRGVFNKFLSNYANCHFDMHILML